MITATINEWSSSVLRFLVSVSIQGTFFALFIVVIALVMRKKSAIFHYALWVVALLRFLIPPKLPMLPFLNSSLQTVIGRIDVIPLQIVTFQSEVTGITWHSLLVFLWGIILVLFSLIFILRNYYFRQQIRQTQKLHRKLPARLEKILKHHKRRPLFLTLRGMTAPFTMGTIRPRIYLPVEAEEWSEHEFLFVVNHELAHILRGDLFWMKLQALVQIIFFFHPIVWGINHLINYYRELACDEFSIAQSPGHALDYSKTLLNIFQRMRQFRFCYLATGNFSRSRFILFRRFHHILNLNEEILHKLTITQKIIVASLMIFAIVISCEINPRTKSITGPFVTSTVGRSNETPMETTSQAVSDDSIFIAYDTSPEPIGGFGSIHTSLMYPEVARKAGVEGTVIVKALIKTDGTVGRTVIIQSLGNNGCDEAACTAIQEIKWKPAESQGKPVNVWVSIPIKFKLK